MGVASPARIPLRRTSLQVRMSGAKSSTPDASPIHHRSHNGPYDDHGNTWASASCSVPLVAVTVIARIEPNATKTTTSRTRAKLRSKLKRCRKIRAKHRAERISGRDCKRGDCGLVFREICDERAQKDPGKRQALTTEEERGNRNAGRRPNGGNLFDAECHRKADVREEDVGDGDDKDPKRVRGEAARVGGHTHRCSPSSLDLRHRLGPSFSPHGGPPARGRMCC